MSALSQGPFNHNRFAAIDEYYAQEKQYYTEKAKPDYLDFDGDGNKKEPMKKALKEKGKKNVQEKKEMPDFLKKKVEEKKGKDKDCTCKEWVEEMVGEGYDLSEYHFSELEELFNEASHIQYPSGPKKKFTKDKSDPKVAAGRKAAEEMGLKKNEETIEDLMINYLIENGFANNPVSAEIVLQYATEDWKNHIVNDIEEGYKPMNTAKVANQRNKAYDKEQAAVRSGNQKEVNKQMQRRIAMASPSSRKTGLQNKKKGLF